MSPYVFLQIFDHQIPTFFDILFSILGEDTGEGGLGNKQLFAFKLFSFDFHHIRCPRIDVVVYSKHRH
jgi:hypothetical protein